MRSTMENKNTLSGDLFLKMIVNGVANFKTHIKEINELNVFPIPDGDTGDNMFMTLKGGIQEVVNIKNSSIYDIAKAMSNGMLLKARGNSGVILSQMFSGFSKGLSEKETATLEEICVAMGSAVDQAYSAVSQPVEGTMLTVAKETSEKAKSVFEEVKSVEEFFRICLDEAKRSLNNTPELLPVLKEAGVVDSGGAGLYYLVQGMVFALENKIIEEVEQLNASNNDVDYSKFNQNSVMEFGYCTECMLQLQKIKVDVDSFGVKTISEYLESIGDSVVAFKTGSIIKIHVHTFAPYKVLEFCQKYGEFLTVKIENMTLQHNELNKELKEKVNKETIKNEVDNKFNENKFNNDNKFNIERPRKKYALITVAMGEGLIKSFYEMGADIVIDGGQTKNPSVEEFVKAFEKVNADEIFILPNNSNIILAAKEAIDVFYEKLKNDLLDKSVIHLIETKNMGQAYSILSMLDYSEDDGKKIADNMRQDMEGIITAQITTSIRDVNINNVEVKCGDYIGFTDKEIKASGKNRLDVCEKLLKSLHLEEKTFIVVVYGKNIAEEEKYKTQEMIKNKYEDIELYEMDGEQDIYDYILIMQ